jgi:hypothetical protein
VSAAKTYNFNNADLREAERLMWDFVLGKELTIEEHRFAMFGKQSRKMVAQNGGKRVSPLPVPVTQSGQLHLLEF